MTLQGIKGMDKEILTPAEVAPILSCNPHWLRLTAREHPEWLGFPVICIGNRVKIPRRPFIEFMEGGGKA